jgi:hypothetical protein
MSKIVENWSGQVSENGSKVSLVQGFQREQRVPWWGFERGEAPSPDRDNASYAE